jgi:dipeptidase
VFSTAEGLAGGPFGDPNRFDLWSNGNMTVWEANEGEFPRTISLFRTSYAFVAHCRDGIPNAFALLWLCQYAPDSSTFTPLYVQSNDLPPSWIRGSMHAFNTSRLAKIIIDLCIIIY